jgi:large subunit ribosomal protein L27
MAHTKSQGAVRGNRDSVSKRLGLKVYAGQKTTKGAVILRQRGTKMHAGNNTYMGRDFTIHAGMEGVVAFRTNKGKKLVEVIKN